MNEIKERKMSVLIKNMEIPEHCGYCRFRYDGICHALQKTQYSAEECPLVSINDINASPTIEPQQWIPVSGGELPKSHYWVNVTVLDESGDGRFMYASVGWYLSDRTWIVDNEPMYDDCSIRVIAWMPLPAPWKGGET